MFSLPKTVPIISTNLDEREMDLLIEDLDMVSKTYGSDKAKRRAHRRAPYRGTVILITAVQGGREESFAVCTRNISKGGLAFLHDSELSRETPCRIKIQLPSGDWLTLSGAIARCRHIEKTVYEIGLRFDADVEIEQFGFPSK